jgi:hypothetical protein
MRMCRLDCQGYCVLLIEFHGRDLRRDPQRHNWPSSFSVRPRAPYRKSDQQITKVRFAGHNHMVKAAMSGHGREVCPRAGSAQLSGSIGGMSKQSQGRPTKAPSDIRAETEFSDLQKPRYSSGSPLRVRLAVEIGSLAQAARYGEARPRLLAMLLAQQERWRIPEARALCSCAAIGQELCPILPSRTTQQVGCDLRHTGRHPNAVAVRRPVAQNRRNTS